MAVMIADGHLIDVEYHLCKALKEHAAVLDKTVEQLDTAERSQAFLNYILSGRHMGAEEGDDGEA